MKQILRFSLSALLLFCPLAAGAQFYTTGDMSPRTKWFSIETDNYRIIYPHGYDSLARAYALKMENYRGPSGQSTGMLPNGTYKKKFPVILRTDIAYSNGVVTWAPQRSELYTCPNPYNSDPYPWTDQLAAHESRHISQMQFAHSGNLRPLNYLFGEMFVGACAGIYFNDTYLEGDATVAETGLTGAGRGRTAEFLNYYMIAMDKGKQRPFWAWQGGSQRNYTPDLYALGYMYFGGMRHYFNTWTPSYDYLHMTAARPLTFFTFEDDVAKKHTGFGRSGAFRRIADSTYADWRRNMLARGPFTRSDTISRPGRTYARRTGMTLGADGRLYSFKADMENSRAIVSTDSLGNEQTILGAAVKTSSLRTDPSTGLLWWSESIADPRWDLQSRGTIFCSTTHGTVTRVTRSGSWFNPAPHGQLVAAVGYEPSGKCTVAVLLAGSGAVLRSVTAPDGMQPCEPVWIDDEVYATAITDDGIGIVRPFAGWSYVLPAQRSKIKSLSASGHTLVFTSDRTGVDEIYALSVDDNAVRQLTSTKYGAGNGILTGDRLYYTLEEYSGQLAASSPSSSLEWKKVSMEERYMFPVAEGIATQERHIADSLGTAGGYSGGISEPARYSRLAHGLKIHSWAPVYLNGTRLMNFEMDPMFKMLSPGASFLSQNDLGTSVLQGGISVHKDTWSNSTWRPSAHIDWQYTGLYPVFNLTVDYNDREAYRQTTSLETTKPVTVKNPTCAVRSTYTSMDKPYLAANLKMSVPFKFNRGGWLRGIIPAVSVNFENDAIDPDVNLYYKDSDGNVLKTVPQKQLSVKNYSTECWVTSKASIKAYAMQQTAQSCMYPKLGIGVEAGISGSVYPYGLYTPAWYTFAYGYLPGLWGAQTMRLSVTHQQQMNTEDNIYRQNAVNNLPRGYASLDGVDRIMTLVAPKSTCITADYDIPVWFKDIDVLDGLLYIKGFNVTPHFDFALYQKASGKCSGNLWSAGATISASFGDIVWLVFPITLGVQVSYNGGSMVQTIEGRGLSPDRIYFEPVFNVAF